MSKDYVGLDEWLENHYWSEEIFSCVVEGYGEGGRAKAMKALRAHCAKHQEKMEADIVAWEKQNESR